MHVQAVLVAVFVQVTLTFVLMFMMAGARMGVLRDGSVHPRDVALGQPNWPQRATQYANAFRNQFELPVLFYVLCILAIITRQADNLFVVMAWIFVAARIVQAAIFVTYNKLMHRGAAYFIGAIVLALMWVLFAVDVLIGI